MLVFVNRFDVGMLKGDGHYTVRIHEVSKAQVEAAMDSSVDAVSYLDTHESRDAFFNVFGLILAVRSGSPVLGRNDTFIVVTPSKLFCVTLD